MKRALGAVVTALILLAASPALAESHFVIASPATGTRVVDELPGLVKLELYLELVRPYDKTAGEIFDRFDDGRFQVLVDGVEKQAVWHGGGHGSTETMVYQDRSILVSPGAGAGLKRIEIIFGEWRREVTIDYRPATNLLAVGLRDDLAFFGAAAVCTFVATNIAPESVTAWVNDSEVRPRLVIDGPNDNLVRIFVPLAENRIIGRNHVAVRAVDRDGRETQCEVFVRSYPENRIPVGETFLVFYGEPGGRSGPWYGCSVEGESLRLSDYLDGDVFPWILDAHGRVFPEAPQFARIAAISPGSGRILFYETPHFTMPEEHVGTVEVMVVEPGVPSAP